MLKIINNFFNEMNYLCYQWIRNDNFIYCELIYKIVQSNIDHISILLYTCTFQHIYIQIEPHTYKFVHEYIIMFEF